MEKQNECSVSQKLTERQCVITQLWACGATYKEIGAALDIKPATVGSHLKKVRSKLHVRSYNAIIAYAALNGWIMPPCLETDLVCPRHLNDDWLRCAAITQCPIAPCTISPAKEQKDDELL